MTTQRVRWMNVVRLSSELYSIRRISIGRGRSHTAPPNSVVDLWKMKHEVDTKASRATERLDKYIVEFAKVKVVLHVDVRVLRARTPAHHKHTHVCPSTP
jgi:hypothetical protein